MLRLVFLLINFTSKITNKKYFKTYENKELGKNKLNCLSKTLPSEYL